MEKASNKEVYSNVWLDSKHFEEDLTTSGFINPISINKILTAIKKVVSIIHGKNNYVVVFNGQENSGYINFNDKKIVLSTNIIKNEYKKYSIYELVDLETGLALHEAGHAEYTERFSRKLLKLNNIEHNVFNIIEDCLMEHIVSMEYPGFSKYFLKLREYYFKEPKIEQTDNKLANRMNELLIGLRYPGDTIIVDEVSKECIRIIEEAKLNPNLKNIDRVELAKQITHLIVKDLQNDDDKQQSNNNANGSENDSSTSGKNNGSNDRGINSNNNIKDSEDIDNSYDNNDTNSSITIKGADDTGNGFSNPDFSDDEFISNELKKFLKQKRIEKDSSLTPEEALILDSLSNENFEENPNSDFDCKVNISSCVPIITNDNIREYKEIKSRINKYTTLFRNKLADANTIYRVNAYNLQSGSLDEDSLYSAKYNRNIFMNNIVTNVSRTKNLDIAFLIDCSGSMSNGLFSGMNRLDVAKDLCSLFVESLETIRSVNTWAFGFKDLLSYLRDKELTCNTNAALYNSRIPSEERSKLITTTQLINVYSPTNRNKNRIATLVSNGSTPEYEALTGVIDLLKKNGRRDSKKIIVLLTDGEPSSIALGRTSQRNLIRKRLSKCEKEGIVINHIAITDESSKSSAYKNKILWNDNNSYKKVVENFIKLLNSQLR